MLRTNINEQKVRIQSTTGWHFLQDLDAVRHGGRDKGQAFNRAAGLARQANDQRFFDHRRQIARKNRVAGDFHRLHPHHFAEPRQFADGHLADGFRRDVAQGDTGAAKQWTEAIIGDPQTPAGARSRAEVLSQLIAAGNKG